jgi:hypothetical protein
LIFDGSARSPLTVALRVHYLPDSDHLFRPCKASCRTAGENLPKAVAVAVAFMNELAP